MKAHSPPPADSNWLIQSAEAFDKLADSTELAAVLRAVAERLRLTGDISDVLPPAAQQVPDHTILEAAWHDPHVAAKIDATVGLYRTLEWPPVSDEAFDNQRRRQDTEPDPTS